MMIDTFEELLKKYDWHGFASMTFDSGYTLKVYYSRGYIAYSPSKKLFLSFGNLDSTDSAKVDTDLLKMVGPFVGMQQTVTAAHGDQLFFFDLAMYSHYRWYWDEQEEIPRPTMPTRAQIMSLDIDAFKKANSGTVFAGKPNEGISVASFSAEVEVNVEADKGVTYIVRGGAPVYFASLAEAVHAAKNGETVKFTEKDTELAGPGVKLTAVKTAKNIVIDLCGCTYTITTPVGSTGYETQGFHFEKGNNVTILNGTILPGENAKMVIQNYGNLTLDGVTIDASSSPAVECVCSNNCGDINITGGTTIKAAPGKVAVDSYFWEGRYDEGVSVNIADANISGIVESAGAKEKAGEIVITGGTFDTDVSKFCSKSIKLVQNSKGEYVALSANDPVIYENADTVGLLSGKTKPAIGLYHKEFDYYSGLDVVYWKKFYKNQEKFKEFLKAYMGITDAI